MDKYNKLRIEWDCRRGMLELDKIIMPFYKAHFDQLTDDKKDIFIRLLAATDLQLFSWTSNTPSYIQDSKLLLLYQTELKLKSSLCIKNFKKIIFIRLLAATDLQLFSWFFNGSQSEDAEVQAMVEYIQDVQKTNVR